MTDDMGIPVVFWDRGKNYARKMELPGKVSDGCEHEGGTGYHLHKMVAAYMVATKAIPLHCEAYCHNAEDVKSESREPLNAIGLVRSHVGYKGVHITDRG